MIATLALPVMLAGGLAACAPTVVPAGETIRTPTLTGDQYVAADGTPLALTDTKQAAIGHAFDDDLEIASVH